MIDENNTPIEVTRLSLKALKLRTGMALQTKRLVEGSLKRESQFFGAIEGKGVMVGPMGPQGMTTELDVGDVCVVRGFTGQYEFSFLSKVLQTFEKPFAYALLAYPAEVDARLVRQSMRIKTSWPCTIQLADQAAGANEGTIQVTLVDVSMQGAMITAPTGISTVGTEISLHMEVTFDGVATPLKLTASICHNNKSGPDGTYFIGLAFKNLTHQDKLLLHFVTQTSTS
jgi:c-di-GMP-binding flagellar brake protein YcgR